MISLVSMFEIIYKVFKKGDLAFTRKVNAYPIELWRYTWELSENRYKWKATLTEELGMHKLTARCSLNQKRIWMNISKALLKRFKRNAGKVGFFAPINNC